MTSDIYQQVQDAISEYKLVTEPWNNPWFPMPRRDVDLDLERKKLNASLATLGIERDIEDFHSETIGMGLDTDPTITLYLEKYLVSIRQDLLQCLTTEQAAFLQDVHFSYLKTGRSEAMCVNSDPYGRPLSFFIAFMNEGLYFVLNQIYTAVLFEDTEGLADDQRFGFEAFKAAQSFFLAGDSNQIGSVPLVVQDVETTGILQGHLASATTLMTQFVLLHEFAHAWLSHHQILASSRLYLIDLENHRNPPAQHQSFEAEYEADLFAFRALMRRTQTNQSNWAHLYVVGIFFQFLASAEAELGEKLSIHHPSPSLRLQRLLDFLANETGDHTQKTITEIKISNLFRKWQRHLNDQ